MQAIYEQIKKKIPPAVCLVAVSKKQPIEKIRELYALGHRHFGENYVQELQEKANVLAEELPEIQWHFIGQLQSNKCKTLCKIPRLTYIETVDSLEKAKILEKSMQEPLSIFLQVNTSKEEQKGGILPEQVAQLWQEIKENYPKLLLKGLMTIGSVQHSNQKPNPDFQVLKSLKEEIEKQFSDEVILSMGMSDDFEHAIEMGSQNVRIGSLLFGARS